MDPSEQCRKQKSGLIPHPVSCQGYFNCSDPSPVDVYSPFKQYENECIYPDLFDIKKKRCVPFDTAECGHDRRVAQWYCGTLRSRCPVGSCAPCYIDNPSCVGKEDGLWPNPEKLWTPYFVECKLGRTLNKEEMCSQEGWPRIFHPDLHQCLPLWDIATENGGIRAFCDDKDPGFYVSEMVENFAYKCPEEDMYLCEKKLDLKNPYLTKCQFLNSEVAFDTSVCKKRTNGYWEKKKKELLTPFYIKCRNGHVLYGNELCPTKAGSRTVFAAKKRICTDPITALALTSRSVSTTSGTSLSVVLANIVLCMLAYIA